MKAYVFPGQGAQFTGMGKDLYDSFKEAKAYFENALNSLELPSYSEKVTGVSNLVRFEKKYFNEILSKKWKLTYRIDG